MYFHLCWNKGKQNTLNHKNSYQRENINYIIFFLNTLRPRQNGRHYADDIFKCIFLNENVSIVIKISLKFVPKDPINNIPALVQIMAWRRAGNKPLSEPIMVSLSTHICVTRPQWVKLLYWDEMRQCVNAAEGTHWGWDKMVAILQMAFSNSFSCLKIFVFWVKFHWKASKKSNQ